MEPFIIGLIGLSVLQTLGTIALVRKARPAHPRGQRKADVVARAVATARKHPSKGVPLEATALEYAILIDMEDGKSDFKREELWAAVRAHLANEPK